MRRSDRGSSITWYHERNVGIQGDKIVGQAFRFEDKPLVHGSGRHRRQVCFLRDAKCVIDRAFEPVR